MTTLFDFIKELRGFAEGHRMVNVFKVIGSIEDIDTEHIESRSLFVSIESSNISHRNSTNIVTMSMFVVDKCVQDDEESLIVSVQENLFVIGQVQDFILSLDNDVDFDEVTVAQAPNNEYNLTAAVCTFDVVFDKNISCSTASLNTTSNTSNGGGGNGGGSTTPVYQEGYDLSPLRIIQCYQTTTFGAFSLVLNYDGVVGGMPVADQNKTVNVELLDYAGRTVTFTRPSDIQIVISEDIRTIFPENVELRVRIWLTDGTTNTIYLKDPVNVVYEEFMLSYGHYIAAITSSTANAAFYGLAYNSNITIAADQLASFEAVVKPSGTSADISWRADIMRADDWNLPYSSVYSATGNLSQIGNSVLSTGDKALFPISQQNTPLVFACSNHSTKIVGRFYIKYEEEVIGFDGNKKWGVDSVNKNYCTITDTTSALPAC